jgi:hypothetical protein
MVWLGVIRPYRSEESSSACLWQAFCTAAVGAEMGGIARVFSLDVTCACNNCALDALGDNVSTSTSHSGAKKAQDWAVEQQLSNWPTS